MKLARNFAGLVVIVTALSLRPIAAASSDCNWDGICDEQEMITYYMCGDCGNTYCTNYCEEHDDAWCDVECYATMGGEVWFVLCDDNSGQQGCSYECYCRPPM